METRVLLFLTLTLADLEFFQCAEYTVRHDRRLTLNLLNSVTFTQSGKGNNFGRCITSCKQSALCCSVNVQWDSATSSMTCEFLSVYLHEVGGEGSLLHAAGWVFLQEDPAYTEGEWALLFRATAANGQSVWDTWHQDGRHDDTNLMQACLRPISSLACTSHFRSYVMDHWSYIDRVRMRVYKNDAVVADLTFNGQNSTRMTWLSISRLLTSSWTDLTSSSPNNYFSITGLAHVYRRFYLSKFHNGCPGDTGWLVVADAHPGSTVSGQCVFDTTHPHPAILYSPLATASAWEAAPIAAADFMTIHATFLKA